MNGKVIKNYLYNLSYQILVIIVPLITTPYLSRVLGPTLIGTYSYTNSIAQYFILFGALGLNLYGQREIAYQQKDKRKYTISFWEIFTLKAITLTLSIALYFLMIKLYGKYTHVFLIQTVDILSSILDITWLYQGLEDFKRVVLRNFIVRILSVLCIFTFVKSSNDFILYILCNSLTIVIGNITMWLYLPKLLKKVSLREIDLLKHLKPAIALFLPQIAVSLYTMLDKTMIGLFTGIEVEVAYYEQSQKIIKIALTIITSLGAVMMPRVANTFAQGDSNLVKKYINTSLSFVFILGLPIMFGVMSISPNFVPWFFGEGYDKVVLNMIIIAPVIFFIGLSNVTGTQFLLATNRQDEFSKSVMIGSIVNCILNALLIPMFLSYGAALATVISEAVVTGSQFFFIRDFINVKELFKKNIKYFAYSAIMFIASFVLGAILESTIINTLIQISVGIILYFSLLLFTKDEILFTILKKIGDKL